MFQNVAYRPTVYRTGTEWKHVEETDTKTEKTTYYYFQRFCDFSKEPESTWHSLEPNS